MFPQAEDSLAEQGLGESQKKQDGLAQIAPDLTILQFIRGKEAHTRLWETGGGGTPWVPPLPAFLDSFRLSGAPHIPHESLLLFSARDHHF